MTEVPMRKIEWTENVNLGLGPNDPVEGDVKSYPSIQADEYIRLGWAKDAETGETGDRTPGAQATLEVHDSTQASE